jgi:transcriptional regulator with XRE-family HTH domain
MAQRNFNTNLTRAERERIGSMILKLRKESGLSQKNLAKEVGISPVRLVEIEKGTADFRIDTLIVILNHFNQEISFI